MVSGKGSMFLYKYDFGDGWEHEDMLEWLGGDFDAEEFDLEAINQALKLIK